ncbi:ribonuclease H family protein [Streptomyces sp. NBC_00690]|uniref:ribonuclease H family protein n=1 Tax=Streptomyces sp. NBC_00690 TaxID=2975808 RepID=UPI002E2C42F6|nr:RNase H family protein [Streptomyces sp. NBC_00690]
MTELIAACDGASKGNPGPAAWAWVIADATEHGVHRWQAGPLGKTTNNVAELTALLELLRATEPTAALQVRMDSQYAMKAVTTWLPGWRRNNWRTSSGKPVANQELVVAIDELLTGRKVDFVFTPAHQVDGDPLNAAADRAASHCARTQEPIGTVLGSPLPPPESTPAPRAGTPGGGVPRPARSRPTGSGASVKARFAGRCRCGQPYAKGESISKNPEGWGHPACAVSSTPA